MLFGFRGETQKRIAEFIMRMNEKQSSDVFAHIMELRELESRVTAAAEAHGIVGDSFPPCGQLDTLSEELAALNIVLDVPKSARRGCTEIAHEMARAAVRSRVRGRR